MPLSCIWVCLGRMDSGPLKRKLLRSTSRCQAKKTKNAAEEENSPGNFKPKETVAIPGGVSDTNNIVTLPERSELNEKNLVDDAKLDRLRRNEVEISCQRESEDFCGDFRSYKFPLSKSSTTCVSNLPVSENTGAISPNNKGLSHSLGKIVNLVDRTNSSSYCIPSGQGGKRQVSTHYTFSSKFKPLCESSTVIDGNVSSFDDHTMGSVPYTVVEVTSDILFKKSNAYPLFDGDQTYSKGGCTIKSCSDQKGKLFLPSKEMLTGHSLSSCETLCKSNEVEINSVSSSFNARMVTSEIRNDEPEISKLPFFTTAVMKSNGMVDSDVNRSYPVNKNILVHQAQEIKGVDEESKVPSNNSVDESLQDKTSSEKREVSELKDERIKQTCRNNQSLIKLMKNRKFLAPDDSEEVSICTKTLKVWKAKEAVTENKTEESSGCNINVQGSTDLFVKKNSHSDKVSILDCSQENLSPDINLHTFKQVMGEVPVATRENLEAEQILQCTHTQNMPTFPILRQEDSNKVIKKKIDENNTALMKHMELILGARNNEIDSLKSDLIILKLKFKDYEKYHSDDMNKKQSTWKSNLQIVSQAKDDLERKLRGIEKSRLLLQRELSLHSLNFPDLDFSETDATNFDPEIKAVRSLNSKLLIEVQQNQSFKSTLIEQKSRCSQLEKHLRLKDETIVHLQRRMKEKECNHFRATNEKTEYWKRIIDGVIKEKDDLKGQIAVLKNGKIEMQKMLGLAVLSDAGTDFGEEIDCIHTLQRELQSEKEKCRRIEESLVIEKEKRQEFELSLIEKEWRSEYVTTVGTQTINQFACNHFADMTKMMCEVQRERCLCAEAKEQLKVEQRKKGELLAFLRREYEDSMNELEEHVSLHSRYCDLYREKVRNLADIIDKNYL